VAALSATFTALLAVVAARALAGYGGGDARAPPAHLRRVVCRGPWPP